MQPTMGEALSEVFGVGAVARPTTAGGPRDQAVVERPAGTTRASDDWLDRATYRYERAQDALRRGDLAGYAREIEALGEVLEEARRE
jgi:uncharacterized membrane protein (UPF0182 family)